MDKECNDILDNGFTVSLADEVMPRAGLCNHCCDAKYSDRPSSTISGGVHCKGSVAGCDCDCKCKHLVVDWEMHKERADRKRLDTGTCRKCGEQVRKVTNI